MQPENDTRLARLDRLAELLDSSIRIPVIGYRIGYDAVIGLIPGAGDLIGLVLSSYIVFEAARFRVPKSTLLRMMTNVALETLIGTIPIAGDVFDAVYKANLRNLNLLHKRLRTREAAPSGDRVFFIALVALPILMVLLISAALVVVLTALF